MYSGQWITFSSLQTGQLMFNKYVFKTTIFKLKTKLIKTAGV